jgi:hypothetical protein
VFDALFPSHRQVHIPTPPVSIYRTTHFLGPNQALLTKRLFEYQLFSVRCQAALSLLKNQSITGNTSKRFFVHPSLCAAGLLSSFVEVAKWEH